MSRLDLPFPPSTESASALAALGVELAWGGMKIELDYSIASLAHVDRMLEDMRRQRSDAAEAFMSTIYAFGCYVGEVFVRNAPGRWIYFSESGRPLLSSEARAHNANDLGVETARGMVVNPIGKCFKYIQNGNEDSVAYLYEALVASRAPKKPWWKVW